MGNNHRYKGVTLRQNTIARLKAIKHIGQSYDGIINEILDEVHQQRSEHAGTDNQNHAGT